jgi:hypothetical protein
MPPDTVLTGFRGRANAGDLLVGALLSIPDAALAAILTVTSLRACVACARASREAGERARATA